MNWRAQNGYDWCLIDTPNTGPYVSLTLAYGVVHEPITEFGTLQLLAGMLQTELARPVELGVGKAAVPEVFVDVEPDTTTISFRGDIVTLQATLGRLAEIFAGRHPLETAQPAATNISAAPRDVTTRFGLTSLTLATSQVLEVQTEHDPAALLRYLNPTAGYVHAVWCTNTETLITDVFTPPAGQTTPRAATSQYLPDAHPGGMDFPAGHALVSTVVPRTPDGSAAIRILAQQTAHHVTETTQLNMAVSVSLVPVGPDVLATIMTPENTLRPDERTQVHNRLASRPIPDHRVTEMVTWEHDNRSLNAALACRVHGLPDEPPTAPATQQALAQARNTLRFFTAPGSTLPTGYQPIRTQLPTPQGQTFRTKAGKDSLTIGTTVLERRRTGSSKVPTETDQVDLHNLVLAIDDPQDCVVLIDRDYRTVEIIFDTYKKEQELRDSIRHLTARLPRITANNAALPGPARQQLANLRNLRRFLLLAPLGVIAFALFMSWADDLRSVGEPAPEHRQFVDKPDAEPERETRNVTTTVGETATLPNWTRVTVHTVQEQPLPATSDFPATIGTHYVINVEYCAAEDDDTVDPTQFRMLEGDPARLAHVIPEVDDPLQPQTLATGQCATGNLGFVAVDEDTTNLIVDYRPGDLSSITWEVE